MHTRSPKGLVVGERVLVQNQQGNRPKRWGGSGEIVKAENFDKFVVRMDNGKLTTRNRRFLRPDYSQGKS